MIPKSSVQYMDALLDVAREVFPRYFNMDWPKHPAMPLTRPLDISHLNTMHPISHRRHRGSPS